MKDARAADRERIARLEVQFDESDKRLATKADVADVRVEVEGVRTEVERVRTEVEGVRTEVEGVRTEVERVRTEVEGVRTEVERVRTEVASVKKGQDVGLWLLGLLLIGMAVSLYGVFVGGGL